MTDDVRADPTPLPPPGPVPVVSDAPAYAAWSRPDSPVAEDAPVAHPLMPGEAPPDAWGPAGQAFQPGFPPQPPPGWVGAWHPPVPPTPTADPRTWPQQGVAPGAGPNVGAWAVREPWDSTVPDDHI